MVLYFVIHSAQLTQDVFIVLKRLLYLLQQLLRLLIEFFNAPLEGFELLLQLALDVLFEVILVFR